MIRLILTVILCAITAVVAVWLALNPGFVSFEFMGWAGETSAAVVIALIVLAGFALAVMWWLLSKIFGAPGAFRRAHRRRKSEQGVDALERALIAAAAGEGDLAVRQAARAEALMNRPVLSRILSARAAEAAGDYISAQHHYEKLLNEPKTRVLARRGLTLLAEAKNDSPAALTHSGDVFADVKTARWAFDSLFGAQIAEGLWEDALATLGEGEKRRHVVADIAARRRAVILTVLALGKERADAEEAAKLAEKAAAASPGFAPAAALAARLQAARGKHRRAEDIVQSAWSVQPHPALARVYRELRPDEAKSKRAARMLNLAALNPDHRESKLLLAELALEQNNPKDARILLAPMADKPDASARTLTLAARLDRLNEDEAAARKHLARAAHAPVEPDWSDLNAKGEPFAYSDDDWKRMVYAWGDEARLIHPRHERFEITAEAVPEALLLPGPDTRPETKTEPKAEPRPAPAPEPEPEPSPEKTAPAPPARSAPQPQSQPERDKRAPTVYDPARRPPDDPGVGPDDKT